VFRRWRRAGVWACVLAAPRTWADAAGLIDWQVSVDAIIMRVHRHAAGARRHGVLWREPPGWVVAELADHALGRSRDGSSTTVLLGL